MKKSLLVVLFVFFTTLAFGEDLSFKENGKLLERTEDNEKITELRFFEIKNYQGGTNLVSASIVYDDYINKNIIGNLPWYDELLNVHKIYTVKIKQKDGERSKRRFERKGELWFEVSTKSIKGWICYYSDFYRDFFKNDNYTYLETIESGKNSWTVKKLEQSIAYMENFIVVNDKPGKDSKAIGAIKGMNGKCDSMYAITEETENVDGDEDHWVKIQYDKDAYGWIHGSKIYVERGGPKYLRPEDYIKFLLGDQA